VIGYPETAAAAKSHCHRRSFASSSMLQRFAVPVDSCKRDVILFMVPFYIIYSREENGNDIRDHLRHPETAKLRTKLHVKRKKQDDQRNQSRRRWIFRFLLSESVLPPW
jgi:hypothetical protein